MEELYKTKKEAKYIETKQRFKQESKGRPKKKYSRQKRYQEY